MTAKFSIRAALKEKSYEEELEESAALYEQTKGEEWFWPWLKDMLVLNFREDETVKAELAQARKDIKTLKNSLTALSLRVNALETAKEIDQKAEEKVASMMDRVKTPEGIIASILGALGTAYLTLQQLGVI